MDKIQDDTEWLVDNEILEDLDILNEYRSFNEKE